MIATDVLTPEIMGRLDADAATARGLPGRAYGAEFYELEQHQVFPKVWCTLALASDVPNPGDVAPVELAGWPLLVVRDAAAEIRVFHNMCRHRAMRLVNEPCNVGDVLSCPWHAWRYGLDGSLLASPRLGGEREHRVEGFAPAALAGASAHGALARFRVRQHRWTGTRIRHPYCTAEGVVRGLRFVRTGTR